MRYLLSLLSLDSESDTNKSPKPEITWVIVNGKYLEVNRAG